MRVAEVFGGSHARGAQYEQIPFTQQLANNKNNKNNTDMSDILDEQDCEVEEYEKKIGKLFGKK